MAPDAVQPRASGTATPWSWANRVRPCAVKLTGMLLVVGEMLARSTISGTNKNPVFERWCLAVRAHSGRTMESRSGGFTALEVAVRHGSSTAITRLLEAGARATDAAMTIAVENNQSDMVDELLHWGASPHDGAVEAAAKGWDPRTPHTDGTSRLILRKLLMAGGCPHSVDRRIRMEKPLVGRRHVWATPGSRSVLGIALEANDDLLLDAALAAGADPDLHASKYDETAWHAAARLNRHGAIPRLAKADAVSRRRRRAQLVCWGAARDNFGGD